MELHNNIDNAFQMIHNAILNKAIKWNDFRSVGIEEDYHDWYYAENRLYVIHDRILDKILLVQANSPADAWESFQMEIAAIWGHEVGDALEAE